MTPTWNILHYYYPLQAHILFPATPVSFYIHHNIIYSYINFFRKCNVI
jgi:hypothetical protein